MLQLLVRNARVHDGLGTPPRRADVGVRDGKVVAIEDRIAEPAVETREAEGMALLPGFVDIHTHYDLEVEISPGLPESVRHGVTTVVMGHCSLSLTVGDPETLADIFLRVEGLPPVLVRKWLKQAVEWKSPGGYFEHLRGLRLGPNVAPMLGHSALRAEVMGLERSLSGFATDDDLARMRALAAEALDAGAIGISVDGVPWHMMSGPHRGRTIPSQHADFREVRAMADLCRDRDAVFQVTPNPQRPMSFAEILRLSLGGTRLPLRLTVLSALDSVVDRSLWRLFPATLFVFNRLLGANIRFQTLTEPFTVFSDGPITPLFEEFPAGARLNDCDTGEERRALWRDKMFRAKFRREWERWHRTFHRRLDQMTIIACPDPSLVGRSFADIAERESRDGIEVFIDLLERFDESLRWVSTGANDRPEVRRKLLSHPGILPGFTDAGAHVRNLGYYDGALSLLRQAATTGFLPLEKAIARVTGEPARWYGLDCGVLRVGAKADLVLLRTDALTTPIAEMVEIEDPLLDGAPRLVKRGSAELVDSVWIAGRLACRDGEPCAVLGREPLGELLAIVPPDRRDDTRERLLLDGEPHPFTDYWDVFLLKHQKWPNVAFHVAGVLIFYGFAAAAIALRDARLLLALPLSQIVGLVGHALFERSPIDLRDAIFSVRASRCLNRMFARVVTGRYGDDVRVRRESLQAYRTARGLATDGKPAA